jgi:hypothetical protein
VCGPISSCIPGARVVPKSTIMYLTPTIIFGTSDETATCSDYVLECSDNDGCRIGAACKRHVTPAHTQPDALAEKPCGGAEQRVHWAGSSAHLWLVAPVSSAARRGWGCWLGGWLAASRARRSHQAGPRATAQRAHRPVRAAVAMGDLHRGGASSRGAPSGAARGADCVIHHQPQADASKAEQMMDGRLRCLRLDERSSRVRGRSGQRWRSPCRQDRVAGGGAGGVGVLVAHHQPQAGMRPSRRRARGGAHGTTEAGIPCTQRQPARRGDGRS